MTFKPSTSREVDECISLLTSSFEDVLLLQGKNKKEVALKGTPEHQKGADPAGGRPCGYVGIWNWERMRFFFLVIQ